MLVGLYFHKLEKENYETNFLQVYIFTSVNARNKCGFMFSRFYNFLGDTKKYKPGTPAPTPHDPGSAFTTPPPKEINIGFRV